LSYSILYFLFRGINYLSSEKFLQLAAIKKAGPSLTLPVNGCGMNKLVAQEFSAEPD
jgi:hypothetical protein